MCSFIRSYSADKSIPAIVYSNRNEIRSLDLHSFASKSLTMGLKNTVALDFFYSNSTVTMFWTDVVDDKIFKGTYDSEREFASAYNIRARLDSKSLIRKFFRSRHI